MFLVDRDNCLKVLRKIHGDSGLEVRKIISEEIKINPQPTNPYYFLCVTRTTCLLFFYTNLT